MTTDFRALCAELLRGLDENRHPEVRYPGHLRLVMAAARAALAESDGPAVPDGREPASVASEASGASPADGEVAELVKWLRETGDLACQADAEEGQRYWSVADLLERLSPPPQAAELEYTKPNCADCGGPIGQDKGPLDGWQLEDGRTVCHSCCVIDFRGIVDAALGSP